MKGLLLQEFYSMKQIYKVYGGAFLLYFIIGIMRQDVSGYGSVLLVLSSMIVVNMFGYHEKSKWEMYAATMPVSRKQMVQSFYAAGGIVMGGTALLCVIMNIVDVVMFGADFGELIWITAAFGEMALLYTSVFIPILIHFGVEKGRVVLIAVYLLPFLLVYMISNTVEMQDEILHFIFSRGFLGIAALILLVIVFISYVISGRLYMRKEF